MVRVSEIFVLLKWVYGEIRLNVFFLRPRKHIGCLGTILGVMPSTQEHVVRYVNVVNCVGNFYGGK